MSTPNEITSLIAQISPNNIEQFCRLKFPANEFEPCRPGAGGHFRLDYSDALTDKNSAFVLRQFLDLTVDDTVQVIGRFMDKTLKIPILVYSVCLKGSISSRSSRKKQAEFAMFLLRQAKIDLGKYKGAWSQHYSTALFFFHDEIGNFRMSLIESLETRFRRFTFFVEHDTTGTKNRTFRYRMTNATANDKAARGDVEKWTGYDNIKAAFSVETLAKEFYNELFKWYERAVDSPTVIFPCDAAHKKPEETEEQFKVRIKSEQIIRLITRLLFVWFIKQKNLVPATLFDKTKLTKILQVFDDKNGDNYYRAILQNLFFATLNSEIKDRAFAADGTQVENSEHFDIKTLYRYRHEFAIPEKDVLALFCTIPFLNGGLFECLDRGAKYFDGFSRNLQQMAHVSNAFFFDEDDKTLGLIPLLNRYNFTVDENAPGDEDVALDPELLGKVFENLLASYNPETSTTARNATGSFYTPREIVSYMVDESLIAYLLTKMQDSAIEDDETQREENETILRRLFSDGVRSDDEALCQRLDQTLITAKILDPACGSGAFPMGMLLRMVELLRILRQIPADNTLYDLKLELIENCIYGVDIQCIAVQISKLRFFISLVCEQTPNADPKLNYGINPLPNLETKFVAADSLVGLPIEEKDVLDMSTGYVPQLKLELWNIRKAHFNARTYSAKKELRKLDKQKRDEIKSVFKYTVLPDAEKLADLEKKRALVSEPDWQSLGTVRETQGVLFAEMAMEVKESQNIQYDANANRRKDLDTEISREKKKLSIPPTILDEIIDKLSDWDPYDQNTSATFFEPEWMFNVEDGFDIVIGNPPYFVLKNSHPYKRQYAQNFKHLKSGRINIYQLFFGVADKLISPDGIVTYIHPKTLLSDAYLLATRRFMIKNYRSFVMVNVVDRKKTFESVLQSVVVSTWIKGDAYKNCRIYEISQKGDLESFSFIHLPKASVMTMDGSLLVTKDMRVYALVKKTQSAFCRGLKFGTGNVEWNKYVNLLCAVPQPNGARLIFGENIQRYAFHESKLRSNITYLQQGEYQTLDRPAIIVQRTTAIEQPFRIIATIVDPADFNLPLVTENNTNVYYFHDKKTALCVLGILSSQFMNFYFRLFNSNTHVASGELNRLPITLESSPFSSQIAIFADRILTAKKTDPSADTTALEAEIDQLVYQLYGLTTEEIAIVEAATASVKKGKKSKDNVVIATPEAASELPVVQPTLPPRRGRKRESGAGLDL